jgi:hypothetical protein
MKITLALCASLLANSAFCGDECERFLLHPMVKRLESEYGVDAKVRETASKSARGTGKQVCRIDGTRPGSVDIDVFSIYAYSDDSLVIVHDYHTKESAAQKKYGDRAVVSDTRLAEAFASHWRAGCECPVPKIDRPLMNNDSWFIFATCNGELFQFDIGFDGTLRGLVAMHVPLRVGSDSIRPLSCRSPTSNGHGPR